VQCQIPFFVATKMARIRRATLTVPSADTFAESSLNAIGSGAFVVPYWCVRPRACARAAVPANPRPSRRPHAVQYWLYRSLPTWLVATVAMKTHLSIRKRALEKRARDHKDN
jgi:17beta-estradiol 17-dehydrogenase / very-long-chain 3-oxoacyl-CoA reductase